MEQETISASEGQNNEAEYISAKKLAEVKKTFDSLDREKKGYIMPTDLLLFLRTVGLNPTQDDANKFAEGLDLNENGRIEYDEFLKCFGQIYKAPEQKRKDLKEAFDVFDQNGDGFITADELVRVVTNMGDRLSEEDAEELIAMADMDADGRVNIDEYIKLMCRD